MVTKFALIISIILMFIAAFTAIRLTKVTKYNVSWVLISFGFVLVAIQRLVELVPFFYERIRVDISNLVIWIGFVVSIFFVVGVFLISRIFKFLKKVDETRREAEKRVLTAIIQTEEQERKRFAKDLHDGLGPLLSTVKMSISTLTGMEENPERRAIIQNADMVINEAIKSIKDISNNLSPHMLNNFGLASAIKNFSNKIVSSGNIGLSFHTNLQDKRYKTDIEVIIYRVTCELINNTLKHAQAGNIEIHLNQQGSTLILSYSDDGIGFDVNEVVHGKSKGMGYSNMISRVHSIKGTFDIDSGRDIGTKVFITVPV